MDIESYMQTVGRQARAASRAIARADSNAKDQALRAIAAAIRREAAALLAANREDLAAARAAGLAAADTTGPTPVTGTPAGPTRGFAARSSSRTATGSARTAGSARSHSGTAACAAAGSPGRAPSGTAPLSEGRRRAEHKNRGRRRAAKELGHVPSLSSAGSRRGAENPLATADVRKLFRKGAQAAVTQDERSDA